MRIGGVAGSGGNAGEIRVMFHVISAEAVDVDSGIFLVLMLSDAVVGRK